jgi:MFS family permease
MRYLLPTAHASPAFRLILVSFLLNFGVEASSIFLPLYARSIGAANLEVGLIAATYGMSFFLSSLFFGKQSDIHGRLVFIRSGLGLSAIAYLSQTITPTLSTLLAARASVGFCLGVTSAALMAYTYENQKQIGRFVSYGALGWFFGAIAAAILRNYEALFWTSAASSVLAFVVSLTLREEPANRIKGAVHMMPLLKANRKVYLAFFLRQLGAHAIWAIFPLFLAGIGASKLWIAIIDGINMGAQFVAMRLVERLNATTIFRTGLLLSSSAFAVYGIATHYLQLIPVQLLLAISWSCLFIGALSYLLAQNTERGSASGILYSTIYLSAAVGPFMGGVVSQIYGFGGLMYIGSGLSLLGFLYSKGLDTDEKASL